MSFSTFSSGNILNKYSAANSYFAYDNYINVVNIYPTKTKGGSPNSAFDSLVKTKTLKMHSNEIFRQELHNRQAEYFNEGGEKEHIIVEKAIFFQK